MNNAEARQVYQDMRRRDEIIVEIEELRPSDNPFIPIVDILVAVVVFLFLTETIDFDMTRETVMSITLGVAISTALILREANRRTHKRIDAVYKLMRLSRAEDNV
ncbi:hypothetical protein [Congregibacter litoralis]|uniref:Uncharacterized protein n=1 Tax=Congregibacter litoralis KT71 TaxID=314285 RepID=A4A333_9GAMM|nr:hypothetical protein [Congregibacter litoralis]EAQ99133.1 hypothetical protein KT71_15726 [Congregibacter litoralis KT71]